MGQMTTWRKELEKAMTRHQETIADVVAIALGRVETYDFFEITEAAVTLDREFDSGYGLPEGGPICIWTTNRVYFSVTYDGAEWLESVPRHPTDTPVAHVGSY